MKNQKFAFITLIFISIGLSGLAQEKGENDIEIYYTHFTKRCATCNAIEKETVDLLKNQYGKQMKEGTIVFKALNLDEKEAMKIAKKLKVSGQALLLVQKENQVNLTNEAFLNARTSPEKFRSTLKSNIDKLL